MHFDTATRQRWMRVLAHSQPAALAARMNALSLAPGYDLLRAPEIGLVQIPGAHGRVPARASSPGTPPSPAQRSACTAARWATATCWGVIKRTPSAARSSTPFCRNPRISRR